MLGKILTGLLILVLVVSIFSLCLGFANKARIERLEKLILASQEQEKEFAPKFQGLSVASAEQAKKLGVLSAIPETKIVPVGVVGEVVSKKSFWRSDLGFFIVVFTGAVVIIFLIFKLKIIERLIKLFEKTPVILLAGILVFTVGSVWAEDAQNKKPSVYQGIYDTLSNQNKSIGKLSEWQGGWTSAIALENWAVQRSNEYAYGELMKLHNRLVPLEEWQKAQKPIVEQKVISVVRVEKPKPDFSAFAQQKPNVNRLWGNPISVVAEKVVEPNQVKSQVLPVSEAEKNAKAVLAEADRVLGKTETKTETAQPAKVVEVVEVKPQQPEKPRASDLAKVEELGKKFDEEQCQKVADQEKKDASETKVEAGKSDRKQKTSYFMGTVIAYGKEKKGDKGK